MVNTPTAKCLRLGTVGTWPPSLRLGLWGGSLAGSAIVWEQSIPSIDLALYGCQMPRLCTLGGRTAIAALLVLVYRVLEYISLSLPTKLQCFGVGICDCFYFLAAKVCLVGT